MKISLSKISLTVGIMLATTFTFSACSSDEGTNDANRIVYQGQAYKTVKIGNQTWMAENLNYEVPGSKCYNDDPTNCNKYGRLYNWAIAISICPEGWHLPNNNEWNELMAAVGGTLTENIYMIPEAGRYLKSKNGWDNYEGIVNEDAYGFAALPGGSDGCSLRNGNFGFCGIGSNGQWLSASEDDDNYVAYYQMGYNVDYVFLDYGDKILSLFSVRCLQN